MTCFLVTAELLRDHVPLCISITYISSPRVAAIPEEKEQGFTREASPEVLPVILPCANLPLWVTCLHGSSFPI